MSQIFALLGAFAQPFVYLYMIVKMVFLLPNIVKLAFQLKSARLVSLALGNVGTVTMFFLVSLLHAALAPYMFVVGLYIRLMGEVSGVFAFSLSAGFCTAILMDPRNNIDFLAIMGAFSAVFAMGTVALIFWAASGEELEDE